MSRSRAHAPSRLSAAAILAAALWCVPTLALGQGPPARQVVMFGVVATPGSTTVDPKISPVVRAQLRRVLPGHGFKLVKVRSERVIPGESVVCDMGDGFVASTTLMSPLDPNGKVQLRYELSFEESPQFQTIVATPPDQFNFFDKMLPDNKHLLIGLGAR
ncbi:hypothetical protein P12x_002840 [Tundrisphaera lichenicola]|uniref:hypothetical protein n=1 Tax=Tundrisphaera lichenicola TaxID=2029860 RepID=UPI003EBE6E68